jgi:hypothetical protein
MHEESSRRRDFLGLAALWSSVLAMGTALAGMLRLPKPAVLPGPLRVYKLGDPAQHLGCIVAHNEGEGFACPCHGSRYNEVGEVVGGPAPTGLPWLEISLSPDGQLQVNAESQVNRGAKFTV